MDDLRISNDIRELKQDMKSLLASSAANQASLIAHADKDEACWDKVEDSLRDIRADFNRQLDKTNDLLEKQADNLRDNTESLKEHMRRTDLLEAKTQELDNRLKPLEEETQAKSAVKAFLTSKAMQVAGWVSAGAAIVKIVEFLLRTL